MGDLPYDYDGLKEAVTRIQAKAAYIPAPYAELTGYAYRMYETPSRRVLWRTPMTYALRVGNELYAPIVTERTNAMDIRLPSGQWIDYWDESTVVSGTLEGFPVPHGREPIFIRLGAILPMDVRNAQTGHGTAQSAGSLTVLVYPSGSSTFRYRQDARTGWITFTSALADGRLTLVADPGLPDQAVLYRVGRWDAAPESVGLDGATVTVNQGGSLPRFSTEAAANGSRTSAWFYDASARRLIVKVAP